MKMSRILNVFQPSVTNNPVSAMSDEWPEPEPLRDILLEVHPLPTCNIPEPYRDWIEDIAERMQCPRDFIAVAAIVSTAAIIGTRCGIKPKKMMIGW